MTNGDLGGRRSAGEIIGGIAVVALFFFLLYLLTGGLYDKASHTPPAKMPVVSTDYNACDPAAFDPANLGPSCTP